MHYFSCHFVYGGIHQRLGVLVIGRARHARIAVFQELYSRQPKLHGSAAQLSLAAFSLGTKALQVGFADIAGFTARGAYQMHRNAAPGVEGQGAAHAERFVVRVGEYSKNRWIFYIHQ
jgi:hypothetical protein